MSVNVINTMSKIFRGILVEQLGRYLEDLFNANVSAYRKNTAVKI